MSPPHRQPRLTAVGPVPTIGQVRILCVSFLGLLLSACGADGNAHNAVECNQAEWIANPDGLLHGEPCASDDDCLYGRCLVSPAVASFAFCTKECVCGPNSQCSGENGDGLTFICQHYSSKTTTGESLSALCTRACDTPLDCPDDYNACEIVTGTQTVCVQR